jgi:hypothetical protein
VTAPTEGAADQPAALPAVLPERQRRGLLLLLPLLLTAAAVSVRPWPPSVPSAAAGPRPSVSPEVRVQRVTTVKTRVVTRTVTVTPSPSAPADCCPSGRTGHPAGLVTVGRVGISLTDPVSQAALTVAVSNLAPGDAQTRVVDLVNTGTLPLGPVTVAATVHPTNLLTGSPSLGLRASWWACPTSWREGATGPVCAPGARRLTAPSPPTTGSSLGTLDGSQPRGVTHLALRLELPVAADNRFQGLGTALRFTFTAAQAGGWR